MAAPVASSTSYAIAAPGVLGSTTARLFTPPLVVGVPGPCGCGCALTEDTSYGFDVDWFAAEVLGTPLDPWERWAAIHGGEQLPDGRPRFRKLLIVVARQQGKTLLCRVLTLFWLYVEHQPLTLGTSTNLSYAKESWQAVVAQAEATPDLAIEIAPNGVRKAAGEECLTTVHGSRHRIAASNRKGGRSLSIDRLVLDELREHADWSAWGAAYNAMSARPFGQVIAITNQGDDSAVVLDSLRADALSFIESGEGDPRLGLLEWSAPAGSDPEDPAALSLANPNLGRRTSLEDLLADARRAKLNGGDELAQFLTEIMCIRVKRLDPAVDPVAWRDCREDGDLSTVRSRVAVCLDVAPDEAHATLAAAAVLPDGRVRVEIVAAWDGTAQVQGALPGLLKRVRPQVFGWLPAGPAAALTAVLAQRKGRADWPPAGVGVQEIRGEVTAVCMGFAQQVKSGQLVHAGDPLLDAHVEGAEPLPRGDAWVFSRKGDGHCDAVYAAAGAVHLARTLPPPIGKPRLVTAP
jgi:phage terminase large subunit-like protein